MNKELIEAIRLVQCRVYEFLVKSLVARARMDRAIIEARKVADIDEGVAIIESAKLKGFYEDVAGLTADLKEAYRIGLDYSLQLTGCLRFAESIHRDNISELASFAQAELEQLRVAVERLTDPIDQENHDGRAMKLAGSTWPDVAENLSYQRREWPTIRKRIVDWDKANGCQIPIGKPGRPKT